MTKFAIVGEEQAAPAPPPSPADQTQVKQAMQILMLSLATVGKRFVTGLSNLFTAASLFSAWFLWMKVLPNPSINQIVGVSLFCIFVLAIEWVRRRVT